MKLKVALRNGEDIRVTRKAGNIPAVVYGKHLTTPLHIMCNKNDFIKKYKEAGQSTTLTLEGDGVDQMVLIHDFQREPISDVVIHVDFLAVSKDEKVTAEVPVKLIGESAVEKLGQGKIQLVKDFVEVEALPQDLPHDIQIDISVIETPADAIFVKDVVVSKKVKILDDEDQAVVTVLVLTEEVEEAPTAAPEAAAAPAATPAKE
jgi:large subunit ribosomal protein L25